MSEFTLEPLYDYPQREQVLALARTTLARLTVASVPPSRTCAKSLRTA